LLAFSQGYVDLALAECQCITLSSDAYTDRQNKEPLVNTIAHTDKGILLLDIRPANGAPHDNIYFYNEWKEVGL